ncbi:MAG: phage virion morphogenesis protein [Cardiobacteriaceae bacterium]|nr:phage virion morphogenesis protein [Cardiobacteriaceae bacterium]
MLIQIFHTFPRLNEHLSQMERRFNGSLQPLTRAIGGLLESSTQKRFEDEQDPEGKPWAPLTLRIILRKRDILDEHGDRLEGLGFQARDSGVAIGTHQAYGIFAQDGTKFAPQRAFLGISQQDEHDLRELINDYFLGGNRGLAR